MPTFAAIPTMYAGVQFRSRLEARWAAFFDLVGWKWEYEPFDLEGYIPDFRLFDIARGSYIDAIYPEMLVEVKGTDVPRLFNSLEHLEKPFAKLLDAWRKDRNIQPLLLGNSPVPILTSPVFWTEGNCWGRKTGGEYIDDLTPWTVESGGRIDLTSLWRSAGNKVQWKGVQAK